MELIIKCDSKKTIKELVIEKMSKKYYRYLKNQNAIFYVSGDKKLPHEVILADETLKIVFENKTNKEELLYDLPLNILYENEDYMVLNKPSNINTVPSKKEPQKSLYNAIYTYLLKENKLKTIHIITRLDNKTSGLVLVALNKESALYFNNNHNLINKEYYAMIHGTPSEEHFFIDKAIARSNDGIKREVNENGKESLTEVYKEEEYNNKSLLRIKLHTGRTHQIRVHLSYLGFPIIGDTLYGKEEGCDLCLAAYKLKFVDNKGLLKEFKIPPFFVENL